MHILLAGDERLEVEVSGDGIFHTTLGGTDYSEETFRKLEEEVKLAARRRAAGVEVRFVRVHQPSAYGPQNFSIRRGTAHGIHARQNTTLVRWDDTGKTDQLYEGNRDILGDLSPAEEADFTARLQTLADAIEDVEGFCKAHRINLKREVERSISETLKEGT